MDTTRHEFGGKQVAVKRKADAPPIMSYHAHHHRTKRPSSTTAFGQQVSVEQQQQQEHHQHSWLAAPATSTSASTSLQKGGSWGGDYGTMCAHTSQDSHTVGMDGVVKGNGIVHSKRDWEDMLGRMTEDSLDAALQSETIVAEGGW